MPTAAECETRFNSLAGGYLRHAHLRRASFAHAQLTQRRSVIDTLYGALPFPDGALVAAPASATVTRRQGRVLVTAVGEFDLATAALLRDALDEACTDFGAVQVDMSGVSFMDASTVGVMVAARNAMATRGCTVEIVSPSARVVRILRITGMLDLAPRSFVGEGGQS